MHREREGNQRHLHSEGTCIPQPTTAIHCVALVHLEFDSRQVTFEDTGTVRMEMNFHLSVENEKNISPVM